MPLPTEFYEKPYYGQQFRRRQNATDYQDGAIVGLTVEGGTFQRDGQAVEDWSAVIQYGQDSYAYINARTPLPANAAMWRPVPADEVLARYGGGYETVAQRLDALEGVLTQLADQVDVLSDRVSSLAETQAPPVLVLKPSRIEETPTAADLHLVGDSPGLLEAQAVASQTTEINPVRRRRGTG